MTTPYKPRPSRRDRAGMVQLDLTAEELEKLDVLMEAHGLRSRAAYFRRLLHTHPMPKTRKP